MLWMLVATAAAATVDLEVTVGIGDTDWTMQVTDVDVAEGARVHFRQMFEDHLYDVELAFRPEGTQQLWIDASLVCVASGEVLSRPTILTAIGSPAELHYSSQARHRPAEHIDWRVLPTRSSDAA
jgi:hypothetical protein